MDISRKSQVFFLHNVQTKMRGKKFQTKAHKEFIFELVKWVCFVDTEMHKIKIPRFTGKTVSVHYQIRRTTGLFVKIKEASEITGKRVTNKHALKIFDNLVQRAAIILPKLNIKTRSTKYMLNKHYI